ncbi:tyrosine-protein kinase receptor Tie-1-like [Stylophora pistillata]|uniref:tyrosine-protein kinase receptor Tie-1-like n=1 Tax=Stylophora pistillata TaxID=50429 RepID=UPI000C04F2D3|nr:tyrosine-protein kinase receptor Tie-1-like [Stylophora pistillata]
MKLERSLSAGPLMVLIEYVPYGDLLGYLRKSRGLNDTYFQDPDIKPKTNLTSKQLMKYAWWSYGVLLHEIVTIGGSPYPEMDGRQILTLLNSGYRMPKPQHVDDKLYDIMTNCWKDDPDLRPSFESLRDELKEMEDQRKGLINLDNYDDRLYVNADDLVMQSFEFS